MKKDLLEIICCPTCKGDLDLKIKSEIKEEIVQGILKCKKCNVDYEIKDGIPNLLPK